MVAMSSIVGYKLFRGVAKDRIILKAEEVEERKLTCSL